MPLGHESVFDLGTLQEALAPEVARTDGDFGLIDVVVGAQRVADDAQKAQDAVPLVLFEDRIEDLQLSVNKNIINCFDCCFKVVLSHTDDNI